MSSMPSQAVTATIDDKDIARALARGRHLRAQAFSAALRSLFRPRQDRNDDRPQGLTPNATAAA